MDDGPRTRSLQLAVFAGLLVLFGAGCTKSSALSPTAVSTSTESEKVITQVSTSSSPPFFDWGQVSACNLKVDDLKRLIAYDYDPTEFNKTLAAEAQQGFELTQLCLDQDVWVIGERDVEYTIYFSLLKSPATKSLSTAEAKIGVSLGEGGFHISKPVKIGIYGSLMDGFRMLDLEKHYNSQANVVPTVRAHLELRGAAYSNREGYTFGPNDTVPRRTFSCSRKVDPDKGIVLSDTCKNLID